jgi:cellulose synthase (UDP-forming)
MLFTKIKKIPNTALFFILFAPFSVVLYSLYVFNPANAGNPLLYPIQLIADGISILILGSLWVTILLDLMQPEYQKKPLRYESAWLDTTKPSVDVFVPVTHEPFRIIEHTIDKIMHMNYPHTTYILDDGGRDEIQRLAERVGVQYIRRPVTEKKYAKSGNINYALRYAKSEFFVIFDADHAPKREFLQELMPFFQDKNIALVQSPQAYVNTDTFIAEGSAQSQEIFYKFIQPAKNSYNASFCVGTNVLFRRSAIDQIGGIASIEHSEDIWTSILLHEKGYDQIFYNKVLAYGRTPETIESFFRQQNRWSLGGFSLFFTHNPLFSQRLTIDQKLQYFFTSFFYFSAFALLIYLVTPIIYLLFGIHPMNLESGSRWLIHYIPYFITIYFLPLFLIGSMKVSTISTAFASYYPYIRSFFSALFRKKHRWVATEATKVKQSVVMKEIWSHVFFITLSLLAIIVGWYRPENLTTTLMTSFWVFLNAFFLYSFIKNGLLRR